jgi:AbiTii
MPDAVVRSTETHMALSLIEQIQRDAIDPKIAVRDLLRKVKLAAAKLKLGQVEKLVDHELKGCSDGEIPAYRQVTGIPIVQTPYHGEQPLRLSKETEFLNSFNVGDPVAALEHNIAANTGTYFRPYPPSIVAALSKANQGDITQAGLKFSSAAMVKIVDTVRTLVLEWANQLEKAGVTGEGLRFTEEEKSNAAGASTTVFNIGSIGSMTGNLGVANTSGNITTSPISIDRVRTLVTQLGTHSDALVSEGVDRADLDQLRQKLERELTKPEPDQTLLSQLLREVSDKLKVAASGVVAQGVITLVIRIADGLIRP